MALLSKPGILVRASLRPLELSKLGQGKEVLILQLSRLSLRTTLVIAAADAQGHSFRQPLKRDLERILNISAHNKVQVSQDVITYLPTIDAQATDMATVHEVLVQSLQIKKTLKLKSTVLVFDKTLY